MYAKLREVIGMKCMQKAGSRSCQNDGSLFLCALCFFKVHNSPERQSLGDFKDELTKALKVKYCSLNTLMRIVSFLVLSLRLWLLPYVVSKLC